jgi:hypothetical protein
MQQQVSFTSGASITYPDQKKRVWYLGAVCGSTKGEKENAFFKN